MINACRKFQRKAVCFALFCLVGFSIPLKVAGQSVLEPDTLQLSEVREIAALKDPRSQQPALVSAMSKLRLENIHAQRLPQVSLSAQATMQNEVPSINIGTMGEIGPPLNQYRVQVEVDWKLYSGGRLDREAEAERLRAAENLASISTRIKAIRDGATEVYFSILLLQSRAETLQLAAEDLNAQLQLVRAQVQDSAALPIAADELEAELILIRQQVDEAHASKQSSLAILSRFLDKEIAPSTILSLPDYTSQINELSIPRIAADASGLSVISTPELERLGLQQDLLMAESRAAKTRLLPQVSLFGLAGIGHPGPFNFLSNDINDFSLAGMRFQWSILNWGQTRRTVRLLEQQAAMNAEEEYATRRRTARDIQEDHAAIQRLTRILNSDRRVVMLREQILEVANHQFEAGVLLPAQYVDRVTDLAAARLGAVRHQIELARAQARLLSALGWKF